MSALNPLKWLRRAAWAALFFLLLGALAWVAVPPLLKSQAEKLGGEALGRKVHIGAIDFKPWSMELTVFDIAIATADGAGTQLDIARIYVNAEMESLLRLAPVMDAIVVDAPALQVAYLGDGRWDVDDILQRLGAPSGKAPSAPLSFALFNVTVADGSVDFSDRSAKVERKHSLRQLQLGLPFLSNLDSSREVKVAPRLAFVLNGIAFDTAAQATPFAQTRKADASLKISNMDLAPYLSYLPADLPVQLKRAIVDLDLQVSFVQTPKTTVTVAGTVKVSYVKIYDGAGGDLMDVGSMDAVLKDVRPLEKVVKLASLDVWAPRFYVRRDRQGWINWDFGAKKSGLDATKKGAAYAVSTRSNGINDAESAAPPSAWKFELENFSLSRGDASWTDSTTSTPAYLYYGDLSVKGSGFQWPFVAGAAQIKGSGMLSARARLSGLSFEGQGTDQSGKLHFSLDEMGLGAAAPYLAEFLAPVAVGTLDGEFDVTWKDKQVGLDVQRMTLRGFALEEGTANLGAPTDPDPGARAFPSLRSVEVTNAQVDLTSKAVQIGKLAFRSPRILLDRDADGHWMYERWPKGAPKRGARASAAPPPAPLPAPTSAPKSASTGAAWKLALKQLVVDEGYVSLEDRSLSKPVRLEVSGLGVEMKDVGLDGKKPVPLKLLARVNSGRTEPGSLRFNGALTWDPLVAQGNLEGVDLPVHALAPYFADLLNIELLRADASFKGDVRFASAAAGPAVSVRGDAALENFRANSVAGAADASASPGAPGELRIGEELLSWKALNVPGIQLAIEPGQATQLSVREATLTDFFARVIVNPAGRINLQDVVKASAPSTQVPATAATPAVIKVGPIALVNGKVLFSDRFIQPNYTADLSELTGKLSQFSSQASEGVVQLADLEVRGRAEGTASLEITGRVNPLARPLALDIKGRVRDLELPPLSAYSVKYAGYGIERGKMSVDVNYTIKPDGQLTASNNIVLNQLVFGDKVAGAPNSLPVKLAVALLADRNGVIDINLPISGSLNDPQFSLGPVIWKVLGNLIVKAVTAPFSLLASAFGGGGDELSAVAFAPGSSVIADGARQGLDKVVKALNDRPALNMTVVGTASLQAEREALKGERLKSMLMAEKRRRAVIAGKDAAAVEAVSDAEQPVLLKEVYKRADITKPRNLLGLTKDIAPADMEALLLASITVNEDAMRELALQRGVAVKDYLASRKLPVERLYLGAAKAVSPDGDWKPRAELSLTIR